ncbi:MAG: UvrB/UvrC motif-containing protein [Phycisphaerae bacterium]|nr:UvrB/UvrC motif-containing protein [Phycisphaerae bacterium]
MASMDLRRILAGWDYEPSQITVRKIAGDDGTVKIQMRVDLGVLQMEMTGRPDGSRPHDCESLLAYHEGRLAKHVEKNGTALGFELSLDECAALREEAVQYYHRYLAEFVIEDFESVERDSTRNIRVLDICRQHAHEEADRVVLEQHRPYLLMMNTRAKAHIAIRRGSLKTALARVKTGLKLIHEFMVEVGQQEAFEESTEVNILQSLAREITARLPKDPMEQLDMELQRAIEEERYEDAAVLRDRIATMQGQRSPTAARKRRR